MLLPGRTLSAWCPPFDVPGQLFPALLNEAIPPSTKRLVFPAVCSPHSVDFTSSVWGLARDVTSSTAGVASYRVSPRPDLLSSHRAPRSRMCLPETHFACITHSPATAIVWFSVPTESRADPPLPRIQSLVRTEAGLCGRFPRTPSGHLSPCTPQLSQLHVSPFCRSCRALLASCVIPGAFTEPPEVLAFRCVMHKSPSDCKCISRAFPTLSLVLPQRLGLVTPITYAHDVVLGVRMKERDHGLLTMLGILLTVAH